MALLAMGFAIWHALGPQFGVRRLDSRDVRWLIQALAVGVVAVVVTEASLSSRI